jgi:hypothetical protein
MDLGRIGAGGVPDLDRTGVQKRLDPTAGSRLYGGAGVADRPQFLLQDHGCRQPDKPSKASQARPGQWRLLAGSRLQALDRS